MSVFTGPVHFQGRLIFYIIIFYPSLCFLMPNTILKIPLSALGLFTTTICINALSFQQRKNEIPSKMTTIANTPITKPLGQQQAIKNPPPKAIAKAPLFNLFLCITDRRLSSGYTALYAATAKRVTDRFPSNIRQRS